MENDDGYTRTYDCRTKPPTGVDESLSRTAATGDPTRVAEVNGLSDARIPRMLGGNCLGTRPQMMEQEPDRTQPDRVAPTTHLAVNQTLPGRTRRPRKWKGPPRKKRKTRGREKVKGAKTSKPRKGNHVLAGCKSTRACISAAWEYATSHTGKNPEKKLQKKTGRKNQPRTMWRCFRGRKTKAT